MNFEKKNLLIPRPVPNDAESLWERTDNFVPAIPTAFEQEPELTIFVEENEAEQVAIDKPAFLTIVPDMSHSQILGKFEYTLPAKF